MRDDLPGLDAWIQGMTNRTQNLEGKQFGRLMVVRRAKFASARARWWLCECSCGKPKYATTSSLISGDTKSCGCLNQETTAARSTTHGAGRRQRRTPEYKTWLGIIRRCHNSHDSAYHKYGARGISVCPEWRASFPAFLAHIGPKPSPQHTIDRIDSGGNYAPGNVRWATMREQQLNRRDSLGFVGLDGQRLSLNDVAMMIAMPFSTCRRFFLRAGVL